MTKQREATRRGAKRDQRERRRSQPTTRAIVFALSISTGAALTATPRTAEAGPQTRAQQRCINGLNKAGLGVARAFTKELRACLRNATSGEIAGVTLEQCVTADRSGRIGRAIARTIQKERRACSGREPDFGVSGAATTGLAALVEVRAGVEDAIGRLLSQVELPSEDLACTRALANGQGALVVDRLESVLLCTRIGLRNGTIVDADGIDQCIEANEIDDDAMVSLPARLRARCGEEIAGERLTSACAASAASGAESVVFCLQELATCRACNAMVQFGATEADCDALDDGIDNDSCVPSEQGQ